MKHENYQTDLLVAGGETAGLCYAIAASRHEIIFIENMLNASDVALGELPKAA